jgi:hypothetical protein
MMPSALDQAINSFTAIEAKYNADVTTLGNIDAAIAQAQAPRPAAAAVIVQDITDYNNGLAVIISTAQAAVIPVPPPTPSAP